MNDTDFHAQAQTTPSVGTYLHTAIITALCAVAVAAIIFFLLAAMLRLSYPFDLEWAEGGMVDVVRRVLDGKAIFAAPSLEYTSHEYTPFYYYVSAAFGAVLGCGYLALRLVSFLATLGTLALIAFCVHRETASRAWALIAAGFYAATFGILYGWFTLARVDSLFVFHFLAALAAFRYSRGLPGAALAGALLFLAFFTKQSALMMAAPLIAYLALTDFRRGTVFATVAIACAGLSTLLLNQATSGWYSFYVVDLLRQQRLVPAMWTDFWTDDLARCVPVAFIAALAAAALAFRSHRRDLFWPAVAVGTLLGAWASRLHEGSWMNSDMPLFAALAILFAQAAATAFAWSETLSPRAFAASTAALGIACLGQFYLLRYDPWSLVPTEEDRRVDQTLADVLRKVDGEIFAPFKGNLPQMAGKTSYANGISTWDLLRGKDEIKKTALQKEFQSAFAEGKFSLVIISKGYGYIYNIDSTENYIKLPVILQSRELNRFPSDVYCRRDLSATADLVTKALRKP